VTPTSQQTPKIVIARWKTKPYNHTVKKHPGIYSLVAAVVLILPSARHAAPHSPTIPSNKNAERITLSSTPLTPPGWKEVTLISPKGNTAQTQLLPDKDLPPEFSKDSALSRPNGLNDMTFAPSPQPSQRQSRKKDGLLSPDRSERTADAPPDGIAPRETSGWLAEGMRDLDTSRQRRDSATSTRNSRDNAAWQLSDPSRELDRSLSPDPVSHIQGDAFAPFDVSAPSRSTRRR
jgi:hypothetical protein